MVLQREPESNLLLMKWVSCSSLLYRGHDTVNSQHASLTQHCLSCQAQLLCSAPGLSQHGCFFVPFLQTSWALHFPRCMWPKNKQNTAVYRGREHLFNRLEHMFPELEKHSVFILFSTSAFLLGKRTAASLMHYFTTFYVERLTKRNRT